MPFSQCRLADRRQTATLQWHGTGRGASASASAKGGGLISSQTQRQTQTQIQIQTRKSDCGWNWDAAAAAAGVVWNNVWVWVFPICTQAHTPSRHTHTPIWPTGCCSHLCHLFQSQPWLRSLLRERERWPGRESERARRNQGGRRQRSCREVVNL